MSDVNISLANGQLGSTLQTDDGICGIVCTGSIDGYTLGDPILVTSLKNAISQGVTLAGSPFLYKQIKEFYDEAGSDAQLYVMPVVNTETLVMITDHTNDDGANKLLNYAAGKIKLLGIITNDTEVYGGAPTITDGLNEEVYTAATQMAVLANDYFELEKPFRAIIGGTSYNGIPGDLADITDGTNNRTAILIGDTASGDGACVGLALGRLAKIPVEVKISRVRDGALAITAAYLGATSLDTPSIAGSPAVIDGKGFITLRKRVSKAGYYFSGDSTASPTTDDYHFLARGRIMDKAHIIAYAAYSDDVDDTIATIAGGKPEPGAAKTLEQKIINSLTTNMVASGNIVAADCSIDLNQNITSTNTINIVPRIRPYGYLSFINVELGFEL